MLEEEYTVMTWLSIVMIVTGLILGYSDMAYRFEYYMPIGATIIFCLGEIFILLTARAMKVSGYRGRVPVRK